MAFMVNITVYDEANVPDNGIMTIVCGPHSIVVLHKPDMSTYTARDN